MMVLWGCDNDSVDLFEHVVVAVDGGHTRVGGKGCSCRRVGVIDGDYGRFVPVRSEAGQKAGGTGGAGYTNPELWHYRSLPVGATTDQIESASRGG